MPDTLVVVYRGGRVYPGWGGTGVAGWGAIPVPSPGHPRTTELVYLRLKALPTAK